MGRTRKKKKRQRIKKRRKNKQSRRTHTWQECYELAAIRDPVTICDVQGFLSWQQADQIISSVILAQKFFFVPLIFTAWPIFWKRSNLLGCSVAEGGAAFTAASTRAHFDFRDDGRSPLRCKDLF